LGACVTKRQSNHGCSGWHWGSESMNFRVRFNWLAAFSALTGGMTLAQDQYTPGAMNPYGPPVIQAPGQPYFYDQPQHFDPNSGGAYCPPLSPYAGLYSELFPQDRGGCYDDDSRLGLTIHQMLKGSFFRMEYLHGHFHHT